MSDQRYLLCTGAFVKYENLYLYPYDHIIGELRHVVDEGQKVKALAIYDVSVSAAKVPPVNPEISIMVIGDARFIKCRFVQENGVRCKHQQRWEIGKAAFNQLMSRYGKEQTHEPAT